MQNLGLLRQYFGEVDQDKTFTALELWKICNTFAPLMSDKQQKELIDALKKLN